MDISSRADSPSAAGHGARARPSEVTFLVFVGGFSVFFGALLVLRVWGVVDPSVPYFLLAMGFGVLVVSTDLYLSGVETTRHAPRARAVPRAEVPSARAHGATDLVRPAVATHHRWGIHLHNGLGRAIASAPSRSVDTLWGRWTPRPMRSLGVETVGPVPETAYSPTRSEAALAFPERDRDLLRVGRSPRASREPSGSTASANGSRVERARSSPESVQALPLSTIGPPREELFSESELEILFPRFSEPDSEDGSSSSAGPSAPSRPALTLSGVPNPLTAPPSDSERPTVLPGPAPMPPLAPVRGGDSSSERAPIPATAEEAIPSLLSGPIGLLPSLDSWDRTVVFETADPTPSHLRGTPSSPADRLRSGRAPSNGARGVLGQCAECSQSISEFRHWAECPRCMRQVCRSCLAHSYVTGAYGCCSACATSSVSSAT